MALAQPVVRTVLKPCAGTAPEEPLAAVVARQVCVWPFASRTERLFLLVDPVAGAALRRGLVRAMQKAYFASHCYSQSRAVREAALAAHYVLRHHNREALLHEQVSAAAAVAAIRGDTAFVALAGAASAFAWRDGVVNGQQGLARLPRPLGLDRDPLITLWSTPLLASDRLVLVSRPAWGSDAQQVVEDVLSVDTSTATVQERLAEALGDDGPAGVLVVSSGREPAPESARGEGPSFRRWIVPLVGLLLLVAICFGAVWLTPTPSSATDTPVVPPSEASVQVDSVSPAMAVRLGPSGTNVVDLAVGADALYTLDVAEASVRAFALDALDQQPTPDSVVARPGTALDRPGQRLGTPVAIEYLPGASSAAGVLAIVDQSRTVVQIDAARHLSLRAIPGAAGWQELGALGAAATGDLLFLDSAAHRLIDYPPFSQRVVGAPRVLVDDRRAPSLDFEHVAEVVGEGDSVVMRLDDGSLQRVNDDGIPVPLAVQTSHGDIASVASVTLDRAGGLYLADPADARIIETDLDGNTVRELSHPLLVGIRRIQSSLDGRRLYGLVASGVLVFDVPAV